ncbi:MAG: tRNA (adenosine(37)-N6)-threonylcarbamoyltransferase complex ATPase subunit type 1 TsaE [Candidatus Melainabacteria bacterium GWF2_32_7]|nr:MAG: tRNA (adenosine(37)-N6)-threonylcarbamoyltransferase complex ATPase subunit type 1 TsaE [Candidatus Melainabacteria bacterium GWF2_32_7]
MNNTFNIHIKNLNDTDKFAQNIAEIIAKTSGLICLYGDIGAGKTTFVKHLAKYLEIKEKVTSPSFVILNEYHSGKISLYHFDLYRLEREGLESILDELHEYTEDKNALAVIEWAEFSSGDLPKNRLEIEIKSLNENRREFFLKAFGDKNIKILEQIKEFYK